MAKTKIDSKKRMLIILVFLIILFVGLICRMFYWQVVKAEEMQQKAYAQQTKNRIISPKRGTIYDCNGVVLARSVSVETISVTPKNIKSQDKERTAKGLCEILDLDYDTILGRVNKKTSEEIIAKKLDKEVTDKVREWIKAEDISGVNIKRSVWTISYINRCDWKRNSIK